MYVQRVPTAKARRSVLRRGGEGLNIDSVLERVNTEEYIGQYVNLREDNRECFGQCPFHADTDPSFSVTPSTGLWFCFGCGKGGSLISFVMRYHHLDYDAAISHLCQYAGISEKCVDKRMAAIRVIKSYQRRRNHEKFPTYKILEPDHMLRFDTNWGKTRIWEDEGISRESMVKFDVRYDPFDDRLVYPLRSTSGQIINVCGRTLDPEYKDKGIRKYTYLQKMGVLDTIYGLYENRDEILFKNEIILFEGAKSVMKADTWGIKNTAAVLTSRINPQQAKILIQLGVRVVFALDVEVDPRKDKEFPKLARYMTLEAIRDTDGLLEPKMAPVDAGEGVWNTLYERRKRLN